MWMKCDFKGGSQHRIFVLRGTPASSQRGAFFQSLRSTGAMVARMKMLLMIKLIYKCALDVRTLHDIFTQVTGTSVRVGVPSSAADMFLLLMAALAALAAEAATKDKDINGAFFKIKCRLPSVLLWRNLMMKPNCGRDTSVQTSSFIIVTGNV